MVNKLTFEEMEQVLFDMGFRWDEEGYYYVRDAFRINRQEIKDSCQHPEIFERLIHAAKQI